MSLSIVWYVFIGALMSNYVFMQVDFVYSCELRNPVVFKVA